MLAGEMMSEILIIEDDDDIRKDLAEILREEGYQVATATNGHDALDKLKHPDRPRLILLDLMMPVMNGWDFRSQQLLDPALAGIPVVILSGAAHVLRSAVTLNAAGYITKPFRLTQLLETVSRIFAEPPPA